MRIIVTLLIAVCFAACTPKPKMKPEVQAAPASATASDHDPCDIDPTQCFSWEETPRQEKKNKTVIPTPLNRNNDKPKKLKK